MLDTSPRLKFVSAHPDMATECFRLLNPGLGDRQLIFTPFVAPRSVSFLRKIFDSPDYTNLTAMEEDFIVGLATGKRVDDALHLNYLSVDESRRSLGFGRQILKAFEGAAFEQGCRQTTLDVYESNERALDLYRRAGYENAFRVWSCAFELGDGIGEPRIELHDEAAARGREEEVGVSACDASYGPVRLRLGFIADVILRVLDDGGLQSAELLTLCRSFAPERELLVLTGLNKRPYGPNLRQVESSIRLVKVLR